MKIYIFGNADIKMDSLPIRILPRLEEVFQDNRFEIKDPNEEWEVSEEIIIIDTALGIKDVTIFNDLKSFSRTHNVSMHDFDALTNLRYLEKLGKLKRVTIVAVPPGMEEEEAVRKVSERIRNLFK